MTDLGRYVAELFRSAFGLVDTLPEADRNENLMAVMSEMRSRSVTLSDWAPTERVPTEPPK